MLMTIVGLSSSYFEFITKLSKTSNLGASSKLNFNHEEEYFQPLPTSKRKFSSSYLKKLVSILGNDIAHKTFHVYFLDFDVYI